MKITKVYTEKYKWPKDKPIQNGKTTFTHNSLIYISRLSMKFVYKFKSIAV